MQKFGQANGVPYNGRCASSVCTIFEAYLINSLRFSEVLVSHFTSQVRLLFVKKRKTKIFGFKNATEEEIRKFLTFIIRQIATKIFGKIILKPLYFRKDSSSLG